MLNFLRKLRRPAAAGKNEMKGTRYFKYALGEIILVVIGILIALSINNWNTKRQQQEELKGYLEKIANNMAQDMKLAEQYLVRRDSSNRLCIRALEAFHDETVNYEVTLLAAMGVFVEYYFIPNKSGFEALKTSGYIGKLKNERIDSLLNQYYFTMEKLEQEEVSYNSFIESMEAAWMSEYSLKALLPLIELTTGESSDWAGFSGVFEENKELFRAKPVEAVIIRGATETAPQLFYRDLIAIGSSFIEEVEKLE